MSQRAPHHKVNSLLTAKRDFLELTARQYAHGTATRDDLEVAAVEFSEALADLAMAPFKGRVHP